MSMLQVNTELLLAEIPTDGHSPLKFSCDDGNIYYCKYLNSMNRLEINFLAYEIIANRLLGRLDIPTPEIAFPHHGDIFHKDSELLIETRYITSTEIKYFIDNQETTPHIKKLNKKSHEIWAEYQQDNIWQKTPKIKIFVE